MVTSRNIFVSLNGSVLVFAFLNNMCCITQFEIKEQYYLNLLDSYHGFRTPSISFDISMDLMRCLSNDKYVLCL